MFFETVYAECIALVDYMKEHLQASKRVTFIGQPEICYTFGIVGVSGIIGCYLHFQSWIHGPELVSEYKLCQLC